jgi:transglutaminase-like putative cysteine protease
MPADRRGLALRLAFLTAQGGDSVSKIFHIDCELTYQVAEQSLFVFNVGVPDCSSQRVLREAIEVQPAMEVDEFVDAAGKNRCFRIDTGRGPLAVRYLATVEADAPPVDREAPETPLARLPGEMFSFLRPSRYCEADRVFPLACREFGKLPRGYTRVEAICRWIRANIAYQTGTSVPTTTARDVLANRAGVCRDFAHLAIALCRALNIPARFVTGYACYADPPADFHALFEAYLGHRWYLFDPTELAKLDEVVRIGTGFDASDVAFVTFFGSARLRRLSPLIQKGSAAARSMEQLVSLQQPDSGVRLAA